MARGVELQLNPETGEFEAVPTLNQETEVSAVITKDENGNLVLPQSEESKKPAQVFNPVTGEFEYADKNLQRLTQLRRRIKDTNRDKLKDKESTMKYGLEDIGLSAKDLGKTGDSRTATKSQKDETVGASQLEDYKSLVSAEQWEKLKQWKKSQKSK